MSPDSLLPWGWRGWGNDVNQLLLTWACLSPREAVRVSQGNVCASLCAQHIVSAPGPSPHQNANALTDSASLSVHMLRRGHNAPSVPFLFTLVLASRSAWVLWCSSVGDGVGCADTICDLCEHGDRCLEARLHPCPAPSTSARHRTPWTPDPQLSLPAPSSCLLSSSVTKGRPVSHHALPTFPAVCPSGLEQPLRATPRSLLGAGVILGPFVALSEIFAFNRHFKKT